ncbi:MAG: TaqI-like C-terminal specificity domain-containing protein [Myxococcota bacterium]|nr:TaqI-like C-terminal specificity domain-containing protein [Myxococcota bacterium]
MVDSFSAPTQRRMHPFAQAGTSPADASFHQWIVGHVQTGRLELLRCVSSHADHAPRPLAIRIQQCLEDAVFKVFMAGTRSGGHRDTTEQAIVAQLVASYRSTLVGGNECSDAGQSVGASVQPGELRSILSGWIRRLGSRLDAQTVLEPAILAHLYEDGLAWIDRGAKTQERVSRTKALGIYYTPQHIVDGLVEQSLGLELQTRSLESIQSLSILDPACGGGVFLLTAYTRLTDWYLRQYATDPTRWVHDARVHWHHDVLALSDAERRRILRQHIFGIDLDPNAVHVARRVLTLAVEGGRRIAGVQPDPAAVALPLKDNLKWGNTLIKSDTHASTAGLAGHVAFESIRQQGGFDVVVGNPPYVFTRNGGFSAAEKQYYKRVYATVGGLNTYILFILRAADLLQQGGRLAMIVPMNWMTLPSLKPFRTALLDTLGDVFIIRHDYPVFGRASVETCCLIGRLKSPTTVRLATVSKSDGLTMMSQRSAAVVRGLETIDFAVHDAIETAILARMNRAPRLADFARVRTGLKVYQTGKGTPPQTAEQTRRRVFHRTGPSDETTRRYVHGRDVQRFRLDWSGEWLSYGPWLAECRPSAPFHGPRILVRQIPSKPPYCIQACRVHTPYYHDINSMVVFDVRGDLRVLVGMLNSRLISLWFEATYQKNQRGVFPQFKVRELKRFPVVMGTAHDEAIGNLVDEIETAITAGKMSSQPRSLSTVRALQERLDETVCRAFGLTDAEIDHLHRWRRP